jgi:hypothetical protein
MGSLAIPPPQAHDRRGAQVMTGEQLRRQTFADRIDALMADADRYVESELADDVAGDFAEAVRWFHISEALAGVRTMVADA